MLDSLLFNRDFDTMDSSEIKEQRIYIGNLPKDVKLPHLYTALPDGYDRSKLEIRHNYDIDKNITSSYAFVNVEGTQTQIKFWCDSASRKSVGGNVLQVQYAKLSFLDRLKQEVESQKKPLVADSNNRLNKKSQVPPQNPNLIRFDSDAETPDSSDEDDHKTSFYDEQSEEPLLNNVVEDFIEDKIPKSKNEAETKRLESLKERSSNHENKQKIIRMAIKSMSKGSSNKIVFRDSDDEQEESSEAQQTNEQKRKLFDNSDSENEDHISFSHSKTKLVKTKISSLDERFRMDSRFFDDDNVKNAPAEKLEEDDHEQGKLLEIADSIIGKDTVIRPKAKSKRELQDTTIPTRFNPLEKKHRSLIIKKDDDIENEEPVKKSAKVKPFRVEKERFYEVSDQLKDQFKNNETPTFSLLGLFGGDPEVKTESAINFKDQSIEKKKITNFKNPLETGAANFFNIDEHFEEEPENIICENKKGENMTWNEPLFMPLDDPRVQEALKFFNTPRKEPIPHAVLSRDLKNIVKKKYQKNMAKSQQFKTKFGNRRKFQNSKDKEKSKVTPT